MEEPVSGLPIGEVEDRAIGLPKKMSFADVSLA